MVHSALSVIRYIGVRYSERPLKEVPLYLGPQRAQVHRQLCSLVSDTPLGDVLTSVQDGGQCEELYRRYLHDFVRSVHKCSRKMEQTINNEYQVCSSSV